ncbi:MAG: sigma-70 family RNA polymerase sigma factor [Aphanocapsa sp. GSE-SYN-MK-11-07L]|jgi:RNA polymerase sigma-70 factor (ECF subfamily)|nr:sigma-70 family RNA polymerase sigma factor [Aphanocapsa sp. GSE-SYN-MK-11-07L]
MPDQPEIESNASDAALVQRLRSGQQEAFEILYDRYSRLVFSTVLRVLNQVQEAEDVTQDVFVNLWKKDIYNPNRGSLSSFLCLLARSRALDKLRSRSSSQKSLDRWQSILSPEAPQPTPFEHANLQERQGFVKEAMNQLPDAQRQVLEMVYYTGLSQSEISNQLEVPLGTVKTRSRQGLLKLSQLLKTVLE